MIVPGTMSQRVNVAHKQKVRSVAGGAVGLRTI
jgi:hypothetical protein